jgi:hypothetical protein
MDGFRLAQLTNQINQQENLIQRLLEVEALSGVAVQMDFLALPRSTVFQYLSALSEAISQSRRLSQAVLFGLEKLSI